MFDHVAIRAADLDASARFYTTVLGALGHEPSWSDLGPEWEDFAISRADAGHPPTEHLHVGFAAPTTELVDAFWQAGVDAGYADDGPPGPRPEYGPDYYGGFLLDPDGNSAEAVRSGAVKDAVVDHLWLRVADAAASAAFYELVAPHTGFARETANADRAQFRGPGGVSFSVLAGEPRTRHVHLAFPSPDGAAAVEAFHRVATGAGFADNGAPGERPQYHPGYYGAFVLDPDGFNVEVVEHHRG